MAQYEIEIKSLLGAKDRADEFRKKLVEKGADSALVKKNKQLNHYFTYTDLTKLKEKVLPHLAADKQVAFDDILTKGSNFSIRTREVDGRVILVIKASLDEQTSANGVSRIEFEADMPLSLDALDQLLLDAGLVYQAKWSREREEYSLPSNVTVCLDKNAGYGYLAEFEKVIADQSGAVAAKQELESLMAEIGVEELQQDRLARMFDFYNTNWPEYYGTEKTFTIE